MEHPAVRMITPVVDAVGAQLIPADEAVDGDLELEWEGEVVAVVRLPDLHGALERQVAMVESELGGTLRELSFEQKRAAVRLLEERGAFTIRKDVATSGEVQRLRQDECGVWYPYRYQYDDGMDPATLIRAARRRAGLTLRELAVFADTSHPTIAAYESGRKVPNVHTLDRIVRSAGFSAEVAVAPRVGRSPAERVARGRELIEVLELAEMFPADVERSLTAPRFGRSIVDAR
ncbi:MAG: helix-turn-helix transcriptional regulator [Ilumatobacteraceae bacterium]